MSFLYVHRGLCPAVLQGSSETHPYGSDESPGHPLGRGPHQLQSSPQDGDPNHGGEETGDPTSQTQTPGHERPDTLWILRDLPTSTSAVHVVNP